VKGASTSDNSVAEKIPRIVVVGSINTDLVVRSARLPRPGETLIGRDVSEIPGGKGANQAVAAARLQAHVAMIARVGDDAFGNRLRSGLEHEGIDVKHVTITQNCASGVAIVAVDDAGENAITVIPGANGRLTPEDIRDASSIIRDADVLMLQLEVPMETVLAAIDVARKSGTRVILDPAPAPASFPPRLLDVDLACPNETEAAVLSGMPIETLADAELAADRLQQLGTQCVVITLGAKGALVREQRAACQLINSFAIEAIDTTAAGDAFAAALAVSLARGTATAEAVRYGCAAGAIAASRPGAQPAMPTAAEVARMLATGSVSPPAG